MGPSYHPHYSTYTSQTHHSPKSTHLNLSHTQTTSPCGPTTGTTFTPCRAQRRVPIHDEKPSSLPALSPQTHTPSPIKTQYTPLPLSKGRKSVFSQGLGPRLLSSNRHLIGLSNPNLSVLETLNSSLVSSSFTENVGKHAQQRRYGVSYADSYHHKCSGLSRTEVIRFREADNYQCRKCRP